MLKRVGLWAFAGGGVAVCWAFFAAAGSYFGQPFDFFHWTVARVTFPLSWFGKFQMSYYESILLNAASYALIGLMVEPFWRRRHSEAS